LTPPEEGTECQAVEGSLTLYLEGARVSPDKQEILDTLDAIKTGVLRAIQAGMDTHVYSKGAVQRLVFIGNRTVGSDPSEIAPVMIEEITVESDPSEIAPVMIEGIQGVLVPAEGGSTGLGGATIGAIAGASGFVLIAAVLALLLAKRRKSESGNVSKTRLDEDEEGYGRGREVAIIVGNRHRTGQKRVAPTLDTQYSLEGAEIPGSLAAMDALALKPQTEGIEVGDEDGIPLPPAIPRLVNSSSSSLIENSSSSFGSKIRQGSLASQMEKRQDIQARLTFPTAPLSPVRNSDTGISPSKVSPMRLPGSLNKPYVSPGKRESNTIEAVEVHSQGDSVFDSAIKTLHKAVYSSNSGNSKEVSFADTDSGESKPRPRRR
jgi:hypothetical protein